MIIRVIFRATVVLSVVVTKAAATIVPPAINPPPVPTTKWSELDSTVTEPFARRELNQDIVDVVVNHQRWQNYEEAIRVSYAMARASEIDELDELWAAVLIENHGPEALTTYLAVRSRIDMPRDPGEASGYYSESWLWRVSGSGDS